MKFYRNHDREQDQQDIKLDVDHGSASVDSLNTVNPVGYIYAFETQYDEYEEE